MKISIEKFIIGGKIGNVACESTLDEVLREIGPPIDVSIGKYPKTLNYGNVRFTIFESVVISMSVIIERSHVSHLSLLIDDEFEFASARLDSIYLWLEEKLVKFRDHGNLSYGSQKAIKILSSGVNLYFEDGVLTAADKVCF